MPDLKAASVDRAYYASTENRTGLREGPVVLCLPHRDFPGWKEHEAVGGMHSVVCPGGLKTTSSGLHSPPESLMELYFLYVSLLLILLLNCTFILKIQAQEKTESSLSSYPSPTPLLQTYHTPDIMISASFSPFQAFLLCLLEHLLVTYTG